MREKTCKKVLLLIAPNSIYAFSYDSQSKFDEWLLQKSSGLKALQGMEGDSE